MLVFTEPQKIIGTDVPGQSKSFRSQTEPFTGHALRLIVIITDAEMFLEVFPRILNFALSL